MTLVGVNCQFDVIDIHVGILGTLGSSLSLRVVTYINFSCLVCLIYVCISLRYIISRSRDNYLLFSKSKLLGAILFEIFVTE